MRLHERMLDAGALALNARCDAGVCCAWCWWWARSSGYKALGSDLLPAMDEGGFILDYIMPAGQFAGRDEPRARARGADPAASTPEVESTSRRTGLQMGLAAVTEANTGDITVKLKSKRSRGIDEVIADVRATDQARRSRSWTSSSSRCCRT